METMEFDLNTTGRVLVFEKGNLHLARDGRGTFVIKDEDMSWDGDRRVLRIAASEIEAIRDFLNGKNSII